MDQNIWRCSVVSGNKMLAVDPSSPVNYEVGHPCFMLVSSAHLTDAWFDWDIQIQYTFLNTMLRMLMVAILASVCGKVHRIPALMVRVYLCMANIIHYMAKSEWTLDHSQMWVYPKTLQQRWTNTFVQNDFVCCIIAHNTGTKAQSQHCEGLACQSPVLNPTEHIWNELCIPGLINNHQFLILLMRSIAINLENILKQQLGN